MESAKKVRRVKNPESFREKALKNTKKEKIKKDSKIKNIFNKLLSPIRNLLDKLKKIKFLKPIFKLFHYISRILLPKYIRSSFKELKLVTWPSFKQSLRLTYAVVVFAVIFGLTIAALDYGLSRIFKHILLR